MNDPILTLELDKILSAAASYAASSRAKLRIFELSPAYDFGEVASRLEFTCQAELLISKYRYGGVEPFDDIDEPLSKVRAGATLSMGELLRVATVLRSSRLAKDTLDTFSDDVDRIKDIAFRIFADKSLEEDIRRNILSETEMNDAASETLANVRRALKRAKSKLVERLSSFTRGNEFSEFLQDNFYTVRGGRYVLPVRSECRQKVPGLLHDQSASGSTVYIEPFDIVASNNEIVKLEGDERREIERILREYSVRVLAQIDNLYDAQERLTLLDMYFALAGYSFSIDGVMPKINFAKKVDLKNVRHPLIDKKSVVPINVSVGGDGARILLISGPNTGGKTVTLKTVGLMSLMLSVGLLIPCDEGSEMAIFDNIFCDIGDDQDIIRNLSTFSSHIKNLKEITESFTNESLILLDEIGSCTAPDEGSAIAIGVLEYISGTGAMSIVTTHYPKLKEYAMTSDKITNAGMQFDVRTLRPTYKLLIGYPGSSNAVETAAELGLAKSIIETARKQLNYDAEDNYDRVLKKAFEIKSAAEDALIRADEAKLEAESKLAKIAADEQKVSDALARINANAKAETKKIVNRAAEKASEIIEEIQRELKEADEKALLKAKKDLKRIQALAYDAGEEMHSVLTEKLEGTDVKVGSRVVITSFGIEGIIKKIKSDKDEIEVDCNGKILKVPLGDLAKPIDVRKKNNDRKYTPAAVVPTVPLTREINVIGETVADAIDILDPIINSAESTGAKELRIVHGKGTGALGKGIQAYLATCKNVKSFRYGRYGEGDNGVTIVEFK